MRSITAHRFYFYLVQVFPNGNNAINCGYVLTSHFTFDRITKSCVSASLDSFDVLFSFYFFYSDTNQPTNQSVYRFSFYLHYSLFICLLRSCFFVCCICELVVYFVEYILWLRFFSIQFTLGLCSCNANNILRVPWERERKRFSFLILFYLVLFSTIQLWFIESEMNIKGKYASNSLVSGAWWIERRMKSVYMS